ncbi:MAG: hypothetical protein OXQ29_10175 [Rhodospirillaceae bacterium]|nr:hypothetical protein [Rhodospirillaceae bacterium]
MTDQTSETSMTFDHEAAAFARERADNMRTVWITAAMVSVVFALQLAFMCWVLVLYLNR